jgi:hypothetical protein
MDWRKNRIAIGAVAFVALLGLTLWATSRDDRQPTSASELPELSIDKAAVTSLEITRPSGERVVLSNASGDWRLVEPLDAEADPNNAESALNRLDELTLVRIVATQESNYGRLEVDDENAVRVLVKTGEDTVANLGIGKYADGMTMIRVDDHVEVFGASGSLRYAFDRDLKAWRNRRVVTEESANVQTIAFESAAGTFAFERAEGGWTATEGAKQLGEFDPKKVTGLVSTAARLIATGFAPEDTSEARAGFSAPSGKVTMTLADGGEPIVLELGDATDDASETYLRRVGNPTVYVVSQYLADRLRPAPDDFEKVDEPPTPPPAMPAMPGGPPGGQGAPQLPPEVMRQLQEQIRRQQQGQ